MNSGGTHSGGPAGRVCGGDTGRRSVRGAEIWISLLLLWPAGCSSPAFLAARGRDLADVFTFTLGTGAGAKARVGPIQAAAFENSDLIGLRAGQFLVNGNGLAFNDETYAPLPMWDSGWFCGNESFNHGVGSVSTQRSKEVIAGSPFPLFVRGRGAPFYSQIEVAGGLGFTVRLGVNAGEFLDFILGWLKVDIYGDDLSDAGSDRHVTSAGDVSLPSGRRSD